MTWFDNLISDVLKICQLLISYDIKDLFLEILLFMQTLVLAESNWYFWLYSLILQYLLEIYHRPLLLRSWTVSLVCSQSLLMRRNRWLITWAKSDWYFPLILQVSFSIYRSIRSQGIIRRFHSRLQRLLVSYQ